MRVWVKSGKTTVYVPVHRDFKVLPVVTKIGSGSDAKYTHSQDAASDTWTVNHNLGKYPSVTVVDSANTEVKGIVTYININSLTVSFSVAFSGKVYCN